MSVSFPFNNIIKPKTDNNNYLYDILPNGLKVLYISDKNADKSAASLGVNIGSLCDPIEYQGLAHFLEHMLFMGTKKYPNENEYNEFLTSHGGFSNAYTDDDLTNYYFDVSNEDFEKALDIFAQFFIEPLLKNDSIDREVKAVNSEYELNKQSDIWRFYRIIEANSDENSCFCKFSTGNLETLQKSEIRDELIKFYNKYYSSHMMSLILISNKTIEEMVKIVNNLFDKIPKKENFKTPIYNKVLPYNKNNLSKFYKIVSIQDLDQIKFVWFLENENEYLKELPLNFLSDLFGHEGPNSLTSSLKKDNLISDLVSSPSTVANAYSKLLLTVKLTNYGYENYNEVIFRILKYIKIIQEKEINEEFYNELINREQICFDYKNKSKPIDYVSNLMPYMFLNEPSDILINNNFIRKKNKDLIKKYINALNINNMNIYFFSKKFEGQTDKVEKIYNIDYSITPILELYPDFEKNINEHICKHPLDYISKNNYIPKNFDIFLEPKDNDEPILILNENISKIWYKKDISFNLPKCHCECCIYIPNNICNLTFNAIQIYLNIWKLIVNNELIETIYMAEVVKTKLKIDIAENKILITLKGFNDSITNLLKDIIKNLNTINFNDNKKFHIFLDKVKKDYKNFYFDKGYKVVDSYLKKFIYDINYLEIDLFNICQNDITFEKFFEFTENLFKNVRYEWLIEGNILKESAIEIGKLFENNYKIKSNELPINEMCLLRTISIRDKYTYTYSFKNFDPKENNNAIVSFYQCSIKNIYDRALLYIIKNLLSDRFYDELRTKRTIGYVCYLTSKYIGDSFGIACIVQSNSFSPEKIIENINEFFNITKKELIDVLSDETFKEYVNSTLVEYKEKYIKLKKMATDHFWEIKKFIFNFNIKKQICNILENEIKKEDLINFYNKNFIENVKKIEIEYVSEKYWEENEKFLNELSKTENNKRIKVNNIQEFKYDNYVNPCTYFLNKDKYNKI